MGDERKNSILIVDDEKANIITLTHILDCDYTIFAVIDSQEVVETAQSLMPDVILLDVLMPVMDGYAVIAALKDSERTREIPVIFITGLDNFDAERRGLALGAADYIPKPFIPDIVRLRVRNQLQIVNHMRELETMERQYSIVEHAPNLELYITSTAAVEYVNPAVLAVTGYTVSELTAQGLGAIFAEDTLNDIVNTYIPRALRDESVRFETEITRKDGKKRILVVSIFQTGKGNFGMITGDMTEIRELEASLIAAKEYAEHSSRAKSEFLSRMSHEMRTPMNTIIGMLQIIKMHGVPDNQKEHYNKINDASHCLLSMIDDVLDVTGMEYGITKLSEFAFNTAEMFGDVFGTFEYNASVKSQSFSSYIDPEIPATLIGDEKRLKQVIGNLLANAVKFTPENGEISVEARLLSGDGETVTLKIEVTDNGIGISQEQQEKLFTLFEQVNGTATRQHGGIGIGLVLSKRIAEMMGGGIYVNSELGKGAKFSFVCRLRRI